MYTFTRHRLGTMGQFVRDEPSAATPDLPAVLCAVIIGKVAIIPAHHLDRLRLPDRNGELAALRATASAAGLTDVFVVTPSQLESAAAACPV